MVKTPEIDGAMIVMLGSFNPAIFQPRWLGAQHLIRPEEAENATIEIIRPEVADFSIGEWLQLQAFQNRLQITSTDPRRQGPLCDLAQGICTLLPHTPVTTLGLTRTFHFLMPSIESWHAIGHLLAPKSPWTPIMEGPGLRSMLMEGRRDQQDSGILRIRVEPSKKLDPGLYVEVSEEFKAPVHGQGEAAHWVTDQLTAHWDATMKYADSVAQHLLTLVKR